MITTITGLRDDPKPDFIDLLRQYYGMSDWDVDVRYYVKYGPCTMA